MATPLGGEIGAWSPTLTGNSTDWIGANDGTEVGGVTVVRDRVAGGLQAWDVASGYLSTASEVSLASDFTLLFWKKGNATGHLIASGAGSEFVDQDSSTSITVDYGNPASFTVPANDADWHAVVITRVAGSMRLFYDGTESSTGAVANAETVLVGGIGNTFTGTMDDVRIFNRALVPAEIQALASKRGYQR